jgi:hypothetical protein
MAFIKPSLKFDGAETGQVQNNTPYIHENMRKVLFNKNTNQNGVYLYFMPGYKADAFGNGVWYKAFEIRDNFGDKYKEKYYVPNRNNDPAEYFANNYKNLGYAQDEAGATVNVNGKTFKKYPNFGRVTKRQIFNVVYASNIAAGVHVLDIPSYNGASQIHDWLSKTDIAGNARPLINDPERALPVFVQLKDNSSNPWYLNVEASQPAVLPLELADNMYNLDEALVIKSNDEIISKLRDMYSGDVFDHCMDGFPGLRAAARAPGIERVSSGFVPPVQQQVPVARPVSQPVAPAGVPINTAIPAARPAQQEPAFVDPGDIDPSKLPPNPMMKFSTKEAAASFLSSN